MNDKTADRERLAVSGFVVVKAQPADDIGQHLPGEAPRRRRRAEAVAALTPWPEAQFRDPRADLVGDDAIEYLS